MDEKEIIEKRVKYLWEQTKGRLKLWADIVLFADKTFNPSRKMPGFFINSFDERNSMWI